MSHQRYPSMEVKEPHSVSLKVLRLSRPSLVSQHPLLAPSTADGSISSSSPTDRRGTSTIPASLAYQSTTETNPNPFLLTPILNLPPSFGSAYVGETFSCTLCANHDILEPASAPGGTDQQQLQPQSQQHKKKFIRDVRIEAEMKTPGSGAVQQLALTPNDSTTSGGGNGDNNNNINEGEDLEPGQTMQKIVNFDLKEEGNHVLAVTVSYYEATETSGRTRTFRKLYQFICKGALIVRTKVGTLPPTAPASSNTASKNVTPTTSASRRAGGGPGRGGPAGNVRRRWVMEAQLENCSEDAMQLSRVALELDPGVHYRDCNWETSGSPRPVLQPGEVQQCCFIVGENEQGSAVEGKDGRVVFGVLGIGWRSEMGNKGYLTTGKLGTRIVTSR